MARCVSASENLSFPRADLIAISETEIELSSKEFSGFAKMAAADLLRRSVD
jgi:hypothetical protein